MGVTDHSSAWNRHTTNGVGATLLSNWVEERSVGDKIIKERGDIILLSKNGHSDLLFHNNQKSETKSTAMDAFQPVKLHKRSLGKREFQRTEKLLEMSRAAPQAEPEKDEYITTTSAYGGDCIKTVKLGSSKPSQDILNLLDRPITFWSRTQPRSTHGKDTLFSTPIEIAKGYAMG